MLVFLRLSAGIAQESIAASLAFRYRPERHCPVRADHGAANTAPAHRIRGSVTRLELTI